MHCELFLCACLADTAKNMETDTSGFEHLKPLAAANVKFVFFLHRVATGFDCLLLGLLLLWAFFAFSLSLMQKPKICIKMLFADNAMTKHHLLPLFSATWRAEGSQILFIPPKLYLSHFIPSQAVCESGGAWYMAFPIYDTAITPRTQWPERGGGPWQIQTDVPKWVYRCGNATMKKERSLIHV